MLNLLCKLAKNPRIGIEANCLVNKFELQVKRGMSDWKSLRKKIPTQLTWIRILSVFAIFPLIQMDTWTSQLAACFVFVVAAGTDFWDGYLARKWDAVSVLGQFLDPVADKVLVTGTLVALTYFQTIDPYLVFLLLARDSIIAGIRQAAAAKGLIIAAERLGKWKAFLQMVFIPFLLLQGDKWGPAWETLNLLGYIGLWLTVILSLVSGWKYFAKYQLAEAH